DALVVAAHQDLEELDLAGQDALDHLLVGVHADWRRAVQEGSPGSTRDGSVGNSPNSSISEAQKASAARLLTRNRYSTRSLPRSPLIPPSGSSTLSRSTQIGRASCRERVENVVVVASLLRR